MSLSYSRAYVFLLKTLHYRDDISSKCISFNVHGFKHFVRIQSYTFVSGASAIWLNNVTDADPMLCLFELQWSSRLLLWHSEHDPREFQYHVFPLQYFRYLENNDVFYDMRCVCSCFQHSDFSILY